jgi:hypothetical protein
MERVRELVREVLAAHPDDSFFSRFEDDINGGLIRGKEQFAAYDRAFMAMDDVSWNVLKCKAIAHFKDHREGQLKQGFFHQLNEAFAYEFLIGRGFSEITLLPEGKGKTPDLRYMDAGKKRYCEVKSIGRSDEDIRRFSKIEVWDGSVYAKIDEGLFGQIKKCIVAAQTQIDAVQGEGIVFIHINFDDFTYANREAYKAQLQEFLREYPNVFVKIGLLENHIVP